MADSFDSASVQRRSNVVMRLLSLSGPETPPDEAAEMPEGKDVPVAPLVPASGNAPELPGATPAPPVTNFANEPTEKLPIITPAAPAGAPLSGRRPPPPRAAARAVIVYEPAQRRPWRLWVFTACLVALTIGVILGQTEAYQQPVGRSGGLAYGAVPDALQSAAPSAQVTPVAGQQRVSAPLGKIRTRVLEVAGNATVLHIRTADLGEVLYDIKTIDASAAPRVTETPPGPRLEFVPTGVTGTVGAEIQLNVKVAWTLRLTGGATEQDIDMRAGGLAGLELAGGASRAVLQLPKPKGTVGLKVTGKVSSLAVRAGAAVPVRFKLSGGADTARVDGRTRKKVKAGTALTSGNWGTAKNRYDVTTSAKLKDVRLDRL